MLRLTACALLVSALAACSSSKSDHRGLAGGGAAVLPETDASGAVEDLDGALAEASDPNPDDASNVTEDAGEPAAALDASPGDAAFDAPPGDYSSSLRQSEKPLGTTASTLGYLEYLPVGYGDGVKRPLLVFVHGITESGNGTTDLGKLVVRGPPKLIAENKWPDDRPFVVLSMQHASDMECSSVTELHDFIAYALSAYDVDPERVYLTGLSCGALASWNYIAVHRDAQIAAAVLVAGDGRPAWSVAECGLGAVAIWAFHAQGDETIDEHGTIDPIERLEACPRPPAKEAKMTIYSDTTHDSWSRTYDLSAGYDVYGWMLGITR